jgi:hypothetical protein
MQLFLRKELSLLMDSFYKVYKLFLMKLDVYFNFYLRLIEIDDLVRVNL